MDKKLTSEILKEIFRNPDAQYGLAVFSDIKLDEVLNILAH